MEMMDREKAYIPELQICFMEHIAMPIYKCVPKDRNITSAPPCFLLNTDHFMILWHVLGGNVQQKADKFEGAFGIFKLNPVF